MRVRINPDDCIACTTCVVNCPVARVTPKYLGPRMIGPAYERFRLMALAEDPSLTFCSNCKNCDITCPQGVQVSSINMMARADHAKKFGSSLRDWVLAHGELQAKLLQLIPAAIKNFGMLNPLSRKILGYFGIAEKAPLPAFAKKTFRQIFKKIKQPDLPKKVLFFPGCFVDVYDPMTGLDMVWMFNRAGYQVISPDAFCCCGLPMISNGFWEDAKKRARRNLTELAKWRDQGVQAVTGCPTCSLVFQEDLPGYYPDLIEELGYSRVEFTQDFLLDCVKRGELDLTCPPQKDLELIYHAPCHLRAQGDGLPSINLLRMLDGVSCVNADAGCCGISGSYGFKKEKYEISMEIGADLFQKVKESSAPYATCECGTCRIQIQHGSGKLTPHPVTFMRARLEGKPVYDRPPV